MEVISNEELLMRMYSSVPPIIVDVREEYEYAHGHIPGAIWIPLAQISDYLAYLPKNTPVVIICNTENRSAAACRFLESHGFMQVSYVVPGMKEWTGPIESSEWMEISPNYFDVERVYFDHAATTPVAPEVASVVWWWSTHGYGNASSTHLLGRISRDILQRARQQVASLIGAKAQEIIFTSGGTESNNLALLGVLNAAPPGKKRLITSAVEHAAILSNISRLRRLGYQVTILPVDDFGRIRYHELVNALDYDVALVSVMYANNEVGTIQEIRSLAAAAKRYGALFHTDAVQAVGLCRIDVNELQVDLLSISGHKIYGPKGVGALYVREGVNLDPLIVGGGQEAQRRSGTENIPGIAGLGMAASLTSKRLPYVDQLRALRDYLQMQLARIHGIKFYGDPHGRLPNICCFSVPGYCGSNLVLDLDLRGFCCSSASACQQHNPSHVLQAMRVPPEEIKRTIRVSLGWSNTTEQVDAFVQTLKELVAQK